MQLTDKITLVTGASSGIGQTIARHLAEEGATVYGLARSTGKLEAFRDEIGAERFRPLTGDVRDDVSVQEAVDQIENEAGRLDVLVNNAGLAQFGDVDEQSLEEWNVQMETNVRGVFLCTRAAVPLMKRQNDESGFGGHIVNIASIAGLVSNPGMSGYNASKHGVRGFSKAAMKELRSDGIKVSCVYPGSVQTNFSDVAGSGGGAGNPMQADDVAATVLHLLRTPDNYLISEVVMRPLRP
ncbi:MAG: NAD-binding protein [Bacteroidetes bacterium QS_8_64_10]|jgi:NADP-dependent 3-hydroxy acid dehydrogenase YdfG|nr:MAG: NAD-binding protein [Bacteroidetes bacterium QS_8_64_10]